MGGALGAGLGIGAGIIAPEVAPIAPFYLGILGAEYVSKFLSEIGKKIDQKVWSSTIQ